MLNGRFSELYLRLFADLDNTLLEQYDPPLSEDYGLRSDGAIVRYLVSKLHSIEVTVRTARDYVPVRYIHHPQNQMTYSLLWRVEANAFVARANLLRTFDIAAGINDMRGRNLRVFELDTVTDILAEMYQILEELGSLLYSGNRNDLRSVASDFYAKLESAVSTASHCIMILQSACSQKLRAISAKKRQKGFTWRLATKMKGLGKIQP